MKLLLTLPNPMEAKATISEDQKLITLEPQFFRGLTNATIGRIVIEGNKGTKREFSLMLNGTTGNLIVNEPEKAITPSFDSIAPEEFNRKMRERRKQLQNRQKKKPTPPAAPPPAHG